jgi:serine/threonine protein kinase
MLRAAQVTHLDEDISIDVDERDTRGDHEPSGAILMKESFPPSVGQTGSRASLPASRPATAGSLGAAMQLGKYRLIAVLARGGMGDVYLAIAQGPLGFNKLLVVKELRQSSTDSPDDDAIVTMFLDEAKLAARLNHPNVVHTIEVGLDGHRRFIAMEYLDGQSLSRVLLRAKKRGSPLSLAMHANIILDVLTALDYAHSLPDFDGTPLGIVHRDVSPQNVFVTYQGQVKLIDFGVAKAAIASQETHAGVLKGKIRYMAPEQATGRPTDRRADVFAVGIMLWSVFAGHGPWEGMAELKVLQHLISGEIPRLREARPDIDPAIAEIVDRATHGDSMKRYPSALALRADLEQHLVRLRIPLQEARALPGFVSSLFEDDRARLRALIDAQLRILNGQGSVELLTLSGVREREASSPSSALPRTLLPTLMDVPIALPAELFVQTRASRSRRRWLLSVTAAASIAAATLGLLFLRLPRTPEAIAVAPQAAEVAASIRAPKYHAHIEASPASARLYVDDALVRNPHDVDKEADGATHIARAEAPGYITRTSTFSFEANTSLQLALERESVRAVDMRPPTPWSLRSPPGVSNPSAAPSSSGGFDVLPSRPKRELDKDNPYGK